MSIESVQSIAASQATVLSACRAVAERRRWKVLSDVPETGDLVFKTPRTFAVMWGCYVNVSVQPNGVNVLMTVNVELGGIQILDPARDGARLAREFVRDVLGLLSEG